MSTLVAVVFDVETTAFEMRTALMKMQKEHLIELEDSGVEATPREAVELGLAPAAAR